MPFAVVCQFTGIFYFQLQALSFTYGIMFGGGASLVYTPSLAIIGHYFKKRMGIANGIVAAGSSIFTMILPHILKLSLKNLGVSQYQGLQHLTCPKSPLPIAKRYYLNMKSRI